MEHTVRSYGDFPVAYSKDQSAAKFGGAIRDPISTKHWLVIFLFLPAQTRPSVFRDFDIICVHSLNDCGVQTGLHISRLVACALRTMGVIRFLSQFHHLAAQLSSRRNSPQNELFHPNCAQVSQIDRN